MNLDINSLKCREAIRMKYEGEKYKDISHKLGVAVATLKSWFMQDGPLFDAYQEYSQEMSDFIQSDAARKISQNVDVAAEMIVALIGSEKDEVRPVGNELAKNRKTQRSRQPGRHLKKPTAGISGMFEKDRQLD